MAKSRELMIDGYSIYIDELEQLDTKKYEHDASVVSKPIQWAAEGLEQAIRPALGMMKAFRSAARDLMPDEMELSMQFTVNLKGEIPVLKIVSGESSAQIAVTFSWKGENGNS